MDPPSNSAGADHDHRLRQQQVVADLGSQALEGTDLDDLFREAVTAVATTLETDSCKILELQPGNDEFLLREGVGWSDGLLGTATVPTDRDSQAGYTLDAEGAVVVDDLRTEDRFAGPELLREHDLVSGISVVIGSADDPWGVLGTHATTQRAYNEGDAVFLENVANVLASAIERDRADRRRDTEAMLRQKIVDTSPIGITIVGREGEMRFANDRAEKIFGRSRERINELEFDDPAWDEIGPDGDPLTAEELPFPRIVESGEPLFDQVSGVLGPNGDRIWLSVNGAPLWNDSGEIDDVVFAIEDITDQFHRDRKLERYEIIVETAHDGIYVLDEERRFELVNDAFAELTEFSRSELRGSHASLVFCEEFASTETEQLEATSEPSPTFEETIKTGPDQPLTIENRFTVLPLDDGDETKRVGVIRDISERKRLEAELRAERDLKDRILETSPIGITLIDAKGMNVFANDRAEELFGRSLEELRSYVHDDDRWNLVDEDGQPLSGEDLPFTTVKETGEPVYGEVIGLDQPDGTRVWLSAHCGPLFDADGTFDGAVYALRDITERKRLESELERTLDRVSDAFNAMDTDWNFTYVNEHARELLNAEDRELVGNNVWEEFPSAVGSRFEDEYRRAMEIQETVRFEAYSPVADAWLEVSAYPSETGLSVYFRDISERKERERALEESELRYRTLVDHFPNGAVGLYDEDLTYSAAGGELIDDLGLSSDEIVGTTIYGRYPDELIDQIKPNFHAVFDGESNTFDIDLDERDLLAHTLPVRNADGEVYAGMLVVQDVTERREYQRQLEKSNERLEQFASVASHDLQEPLRMVSSYLSLIENRYGDELDADGREFIHYAVDGAERMRAMIDGLLEFSRVETRGEPLEPVDLEDVLEDVRRDLAVRIEESEAEIEADSLPRVVGDSDQLRQVFQNLLSNAIEYSGDAPPRIDISVRRRGDRWEISISDDGIGIEQADADRIFGLFNRLHAVDDVGGSGIGLALCERIVERHGGEIRVDSAPGEGSTFSFTLPTPDEPAER